MYNNSKKFPIVSCRNNLFLKILNSQSCLRGLLDFYSFFFLSGVMDLRRAGKGYKVKAFSSLELAACWERVAWKIDALEGRGWGQDFNSVKQQLV